MPSSVGVNPLLTITAVAERAMEELARKRGWRIDYSMSQARPLRLSEEVELAINERKLERKDISDAAKALGSYIALKAAPEDMPHSLTFSEQMRGFYSEEVTGLGREDNQELSTNFEIAARLGRLANNPMVASFTVRIPDLDTFASSLDHGGELSGSLTCPSLCDEEMQLVDGGFELLRTDQEKVENWQMNYWASIERPGGTPLKFVGQKILDEKADSHWWRDVTTLFVEIKEGAHTLGYAVLELTLDDLVAQATTLKIEPTESMGQFAARQGVAEYVQMSKALLFLKHFAMTLVRAYGGLTATLANFASQDNAVAKLNRRALDAPTPERHSSARTKGSFALTRYEGGSRGPVILAPGFGVGASSFATPTVNRNLVECLVERDYDVWLFDYRASPHSGHAEEDSNLDDIARKDWFGAVDYIRSSTGADTLQVVSHCVGSMSLLMALMSGLEGVRSAVCSQLTLHPVTDWLNYLKADVELVKLMEVADLHVVDIRSDGSEEARRMDALLYGLPVPAGEECNNPVCKRIFSIFGPSFTHSQLNHETHVALEDMFGRIATKSFEQLAAILRRGEVVDAQGNNTYLPNVSKLALPISFIAGEHNAIFFPETSSRTYRWLCAHNDPGLYQRKVFEDYAHMDLFIGRSASEPGGPFDYIIERLDEHN